MIIKTVHNYSPNFSTYRRIKKNIKYIIYHYTGMISETKAINRLTSVKSKVSCHYFIKRDGSVILMVPVNYEAWHAGKSNWKKDKSLNKKSIGIEISNKGHTYGYQPFTKKQIKSLIRLTKFLIRKYNIKKNNILGHSDISFERKKDPGEKFPWELLSKKKIGLWHKLNKSKLISLRNRSVINSSKLKFFNYLFKIGYFNNIATSINQTKLIKSFQRHFRQDLINGKIDQECVFIAQILSKTN